MCAVLYCNTKTTMTFLFLYMYYNGYHIFEMNGSIIIMVFLLQWWTPKLVLESVPYLSPYRWSKHHLSTDIWKLFIPILEGSP